MFTLIILTENKPYFIQRILGYYNHSQFIERICICDWSDADYVQKNRSIIKEFEDNLNISYIDGSDWIGISAIEHLMRVVDTKYVAICRDTDFLVPETISRCIEVLESSQQYSIAHGQAIGFNLHSFGAFGEFKSTLLLPQANLDKPCSLDRLKTFLDGYSRLLNGIFRANQLREIIRISQEYGGTFLDFELVPECLSVLYGKVKRLDSLLLVRQLFPRDVVQGSWYDYKEASLYKKSCSDSLCSLFNRYFEDTSLSEFKYCLAKSNRNNSTSSKLASGTSGKRRTGVTRRIGGKMINRVPAAGWIWRKSQPIRQGPMYKTSLQGLLSSRCQYYRDFIPIYKMVTQPRLSVGDSSENNFSSA